MTVIALVTANRVRVVESIEQMTLPAAEAFPAGAAVRIDVTTGKFTRANGSTAVEARIYGIATGSASAGIAVTAIRQGVMDGWDLSGMAYDAPAYLSDTDGALDTAAGSVSTVVGRVIPAFGQTMGTAADKLLLVDL